MYSNPLISLLGSGISFEELSFFDRFLKSVSITSEDLPPPETPVTEIKFSKGNFILIFLRLFLSCFYVMTELKSRILQLLINYRKLENVKMKIHEF